MEGIQAILWAQERLQTSQGRRLRKGLSSAHSVVRPGNSGISKHAEGPGKTYRRDILQGHTEFK